MQIKNRLFYKGVFWVLVVTGVALIAVAIAIPIFVPIGVPVGCVCLSGAFAMFQSRFASKTPAAEAEAQTDEPSHEEIEHSTHPVVLEENITMNFYFNQQNTEQQATVPRGNARLTMV